jgi:hypothetical protein
MKRKLLVFLIVIGTVTGFTFTCVLLHLSVWWGSAAVLPGIGILRLEHQASNGSKSAGTALRSLVSLTMVGALFIWFPMIIAVLGNAFLGHVPGHHLNWIAFFVWPVGWVAFRFKQFNQKYYGMLEIVVGVSTALGTTMKGAFGLTQGLAVMGAVYVVSRGYSNITEAEKKKDEIENNAKAFREYLGRVKVASSRAWTVITKRYYPRPQAVTSREDAPTRNPR